MIDDVLMSRVIGPDLARVSRNKGEDEDNQTPYQIFRNSTATVDAARLHINHDNDAEEQNGEVDSNNNGGGEEEEDSHSISNSNRDEESEGSPERKHGGAAAANECPGNAGILSPNSIDIRQNARELLLRHSKSTRTKTRTSLQPLTLSSFVNQQAKPATAGDDGSTFLKPVTPTDIKEELEADLEEIRDAARHIALRAAEKGGEALEALEQGLGALSTGARRRARQSLSAFGQLWD